MNSSDITQYYSILQLTPPTNVTEIKKSYRKLALQWHPDRNTGKQKAHCEEKFKELSNAYQQLILYHSRQDSDTNSSHIKTMEQFFQHLSPRDLFTHLFPSMKEETKESGVKIAESILEKYKENKIHSVMDILAEIPIQEIFQSQIETFLERYKKSSS